MNSFKTKSLGFTIATSLILSGCAMSTRDASVIAAEREAALAATQLMPDPARYSTQTFEWRDDKRNRVVPVRLYLPTPDGNESAAKLPLVVFSHGIGGSREGYKYLGRSFAANGYASLHLQHVGSDRQLWRGNPFSLLSRLSGAAQDSEAIDRVQDLSFALDQMLASPLGTQIDRTRIVAAGHSYGANTSMLAAGAVVERDGRKIALRDPRIGAAILLSAPPFYGSGDPKAILGEINIPTLHITATEDDIAIPGYRSGVADRLEVYRAMGAANSSSTRAGKTLAVFNGGSHSIFTDRLGTGGIELNPKVKAATRDLTLAFLQSLGVPDQPNTVNKVVNHRSLTSWREQYAPLLASFEQVIVGN
jgi:dienelactone hydrolase